MYALMRAGPVPQRAAQEAGRLPGARLWAGGPPVGRGQERVRAAGPAPPRARGSLLPPGCARVTGFRVYGEGFIIGILLLGYGV